ncbi:MAG: metallophosphoesterase [Thermoguttaceae bacterium]|nr:metallophosphoesterase [Thermoguttaceae bacterium]
MSVTRRDFFRSALTAVCLPAGLVERTKADAQHRAVLRFAAMSDVHLDQKHTPESPEWIRLTKAIRAMNSYSAQREYPAFDALVVAGDLSNHGTAEELGAFRGILERELKPETARILAMGNHEYYGGDRAVFEEVFCAEANRHDVINGYHFITVSPENGECDEGPYLYIRPWLAEELENACEAAPERPIFVVQHYNVYNTIWGSADLPGDFHAGVKDLLGVIDRYPQVVHISGHSHAPSVHPRSMWQGAFSAVGTGSMSLIGGITEGIGQILYLDGIDFSYSGGTFLVFEVYDDQSILIKLYDTVSDSFLDREYFLADPRDPEKFAYTDRRFDTAAAALWPQGAHLGVIETTPQGALLDLPAALDDDDVIFYTLTVEKIGSQEEEQQPPRVIRYWSEYYLKNRAERLKVPIGSLTPGTAYRVSVVGTNAFKKQTPTALTAEFTTAGQQEVSTCQYKRERNYECYKTRLP